MLRYLPYKPLAVLIGHDVTRLDLLVGVYHRLERRHTGQIPGRGLTQGGLGLLDLTEKTVGTMYDGGIHGSSVTEFSRTAQRVSHANREIIWPDAGQLRDHGLQSCSNPETPLEAETPCMPRRRYYLLVIVVAVLAALGLLAPAATAKEHAAWVDPATGEQTSSVASSLVDVDFQGEFLGWAMRDDGGTLVGANMTSTSSTESMIKTWVVADFLRLRAKPADKDLRRASEAIRWSDDNDTEALYRANGANKSIERMIQICGLKDTKVHDGWWSRTLMSPRDAVKLGECLADGTAAGPTWTPWLLGEMRHVQGSTAAKDQFATRGGGRWGIIDGVPDSMTGTVAIKNGWTPLDSDGNWHLNCLAIGDGWTMSVMMRYPSKLGLDYGAGVCRSVAAQLLQ
jgi:hypothetical protein